MKLFDFIRKCKKKKKKFNIIFIRKITKTELFILIFEVILVFTSEVIFIIIIKIISKNSYFLYSI